MVARIVVLTRAWPYPPGEQFVSDEAPFWVREGVEVVVMPWWAHGRPGVVPAGIRLDLTLARRNRLQDVRALLAAPLQPSVRKEMAELLQDQTRLAPSQLVNVLRSARGALLARDALRAWIRRNGPIDVVYSYWFDSWTLGALLLKGEGVGRVASRVHGYDLYEDRNPSGHLPLRRALVDRLDLLLPVARSGGEYAVRTYGIDPSVVQHAPLGVDLAASPSPTSPQGELHLLSVAGCLPVKRVDRLIDAVQLLATAHPELKIHWTHLGGGGQYDDLAPLAQAGARVHANLSADMPGQVERSQVNRLLAAGPVDLFVNTSQSEGVPVSVMEAMAHSVPAVAPAVGAMEEIIPADGRAGRLLSAAPSPREIADSLWQVHELAKQPPMRQAARTVVAEQYQRETNHQRVMDLLVGLAEHRDRQAVATAGSEG